MGIRFELRERSDVGVGALAGRGAVLEARNQSEVDVADDTLRDGIAVVREQRAVRESGKLLDVGRSRSLEIDQNLLVGIDLRHLDRNGRRLRRRGRMDDRPYRGRLGRRSVGARDRHGRDGMRRLVVVHIEKDEVALHRRGSGRWLGLERGIECLHPIDGGARLGTAPLGGELLVKRLQLLDRFGLSILAHELVGEHQANVILIRAEVRELLQRAKGLLELTGFLHPVRVLEKVLFGVVDEAFARADLAELVVDRVPAGRVAKNLVAQRDSVIEEPAIRVEINRFFVVIDGIAHVATPQQQVPNAVVEGNVGFIDVLVQLRQNLRVSVERLVELFLLLVLERSLLELGDVRHQRVGSSKAGRPLRAASGAA